MIKSWPVGKKVAILEAVLWSICAFYAILFIVACFVHFQNVVAKTSFALVVAIHLAGAASFSWRRHVNNSFNEYQ